MKKQLPTPLKILFYIVLLPVITVTGLYLMLLIRKPRENTHPTCNNCNVIIISIGTLRADHMPCYGYDRNTMPNLCDFANKNILFKKFYSQSNFTLDDYMSLITSLYPSSHQVTTAYKDSLADEIVTLPQIMNKQGYDTFYVGPLDDPTIPLTKGFERGFSEFIQSNGNITDLLYTLKEKLNPGENKKPFFVFFHSYGAHAPYTLPDNYTDVVFATNTGDIPRTENEYQKFDEKFLTYAIKALKERVGKSDTEESLKRNTFIYKGLSGAKSVSAAKEFFDQNSAPDLKSLFYNYYFENINKNDPDYISALVDLYDEKLRSIDNGLKDLLAFLRDTPTSQNTIVIITSDHGEEFAEHGELDHIHNIYETETHIPLIMAIPGYDNIYFEPISQTIDLSPTILGTLGKQIPEQFQGRNMFPYFSGNNVIENSFAISEEHGSKLRTIKLGNWRLYVNGDDYSVSQLFDLDTDPNEQHNIILSSKDIAENLRNLIKDILDKTPIYQKPKSEFPKWIDSKEREKLIKEGYF